MAASVGQGAVICRPPLHQLTPVLHHYQNDEVSEKGCSIKIFITVLLPLACQAHLLGCVPAPPCLIESLGFEALHVAGYGVKHDVRGEFLAPQLAAEVLHATELGCISLKG